MSVPEQSGFEDEADSVVERERRDAYLYDPDEELRGAAFLLLCGVVGMSVALIALGYFVGRWAR